MQHQPSNLSDPDELVIQDFDVRGAVFVIPIDAPVPSELSDIEIPSGTLYQRIEPITHDPELEFALVPVSGAELLALDRVWRTLQGAKKVHVLYDLPGAKYDVMFTQAAKMIGLHRADWATLSLAMAKRVRVMQRTGDSSPWLLQKAHEGSDVVKDVLPDNDIRGTSLSVPEERDDDETA